MTKVELISATLDVSGNRTAEQLMVHIARVSSPVNQENHATASKLIKYMIDHAHWSPFEQIDMGVKITTSRAVSRQILRHDIHVQEFSQRYAKQESGAILYDARAQHPTNRQASTDDLSADTKRWFREAQEVNWGAAYQLYEDALARGVAKECARTLLPEGAVSTLYLKTTARNWIHYLRVRCGEETQLEHREIALAIRDIFTSLFPDTSTALGWI